MITFLKTSGCPDCAAIEESLKEMCLAHNVVTAGRDEKRCTLLPEDAEPPMLMDDKQIAQGHKNIVGYLRELEGFKDLWYKFQSDACYCDESGRVE